MPNPSITFRLPSEVKSMLQQKAKTQFSDVTALLNKVLVEYFPLKEANERSRSIERELEEMKRQFAESKTELSFYENSKLDYYFTKLRGKEVGGRKIETKNDLFQVILNQFDYHLEDDKVKLMDTSVEVKESPKSRYFLGIIALIITAFFGFIFWIFYTRKTSLTN